MVSGNLIRVSPRFRLDLSNRLITSTRSGEGVYSFDSKRAARLIFQDRMEGWFFTPAKNLLDDNHVIAAIGIVTPLIESLQVYKSGKPKANFTERAKKIFQYLCQKDRKHFSKNHCPRCTSEGTELCKKPIDLLHQGVRCGLAHQGFLQKATDDRLGKNSIIISSRKNSFPIIYEAPEMTIYAPSYIDAIKNAFDEYYVELENGIDRESEVCTSEISSNFMKIWDMNWNTKKNSFKVTIEELPDHSYPI